MVRGRARPRVTPDLLTAARVQRVDLVGAGNVHDAIGHQRRGLQSEIGHGVDPLHGQVLHVLPVDLFERAVAVAVDIAVVSGPLAGFGAQDGVDVLAAHGFAMAGKRTRGQSTETAEERDQIAFLLGSRH